MKRFIILSTCCIFAVCSQYVNAQTVIFGTEIPGLLEKDKSGEYDKIIEKLLVKPGLAIFKLVPPARAYKSFAECTNCCFTPANLNPEFYDFKGNIVKTEPMNIAKIYIFTAKGSPIINKLSDLKGKTVGARKGMPYGKSFETAGLKIDWANTIISSIRKLDKGRIDALIAYVPDAYDAFKSLGIQPYPHDKDNPIAVHEDCLVCRDVSPELIDTFNKGLK